jgi:hypothetical protein
MVACFLRARSSTRPGFGTSCSHCSPATDRTPRSSLSPRVGNASEDAYRELLLDRHRAWARREGLCGGFPRQVDWFRAALTPDEVLAIFYINWDWWLRISGGTRRPLDAARRIREGAIRGSTAEERLRRDRTLVRVLRRRCGLCPLLRHGGSCLPIPLVSPGAVPTDHRKKGARGGNMVSPTPKREEPPGQAALQGNGGGWIWFELSTTRRMARSLKRVILPQKPYLSSFQ